MKKLNVEKVLLGRDIIGIVEGEGSKSSKIKALFMGGVEVGEIAKLLDIRYNFAYNVISNMCIVQGIEDIQTSRSSGSGKKQEIQELLSTGMTVKEVAKATKSNMNYIYKIKNSVVEKVEEAV